MSSEEYLYKLLIDYSSNKKNIIPSYLKGYEAIYGVDQANRIDKIVIKNNLDYLEYILMKEQITKELINNWLDLNREIPEEHIWLVLSNCINQDVSEWVWSKGVQDLHHQKLDYIIMELYKEKFHMNAQR